MLKYHIKRLGVSFLRCQHKSTTATMDQAFLQSRLVHGNKPQKLTLLGSTIRFLSRKTVFWKSIVKTMPYECTVEKLRILGPLYWLGHLQNASHWYLSMFEYSKKVHKASHVIPSKLEVQNGNSVKILFTPCLTATIAITVPAARRFGQTHQSLPPSDGWWSNQPAIRLKMLGCAQLAFFRMEIVCQPKRWDLMWKSLKNIFVFQNFKSNRPPTIHLDSRALNSLSFVNGVKPGIYIMPYFCSWKTRSAAWWLTSPNILMCDITEQKLSPWWPDCFWGMGIWTSILTYDWMHLSWTIAIFCGLKLLVH